MAKRVGQKGTIRPGDLVFFRPAELNLLVEPVEPVEPLTDTGFPPLDPAWIGAALQQVGVQVSKSPLNDARGERRLLTPLDRRSRGKRALLTVNLSLWDRRLDGKRLRRLTKQSQKQPHPIAEVSDAVQAINGQPGQKPEPILIRDDKGNDLYRIVAAAPNWLGAAF